MKIDHDQGLQQGQLLEGHSPEEFSSNPAPAHLPVVFKGSIQKLWKLTYCLAALWGNNFAGSICAVFSKTDFGWTCGGSITV